MKKIAHIILSEYYSFIKGSLPYFFDEKKITLQIGDTVLVPFGQKKNLAGIVVSIGDKDKNIEDSKIKDVLKKLPYSLSEEYIELSQKMSQYYFCPLQKCLRLFLPKKIWSGVYKEKKEVFWRLIPSCRLHESLCHPREGGDPPRKGISPSQGLKSEQACVRSFDKLRMTELFVNLKGEKQKKVLELFSDVKEMSHKELQEKSGASLSTLKTLQEKSFIEKFEKTPEIPEFKIDESAFQKLSEDQVLALESLKKYKKNLLHGVTGAGKTEVFLHFFKWIYEKDVQAQCLLLVPEIALTHQMIAYFEKAFSQSVAVVHSKISDTEKHRIWIALQKGDIRFVIGSRSAIFLPFKNLQALIIDEEHEWTYKSDKAPKYHVRMVAEFMLGYKSLSKSVKVEKSEGQKVDNANSKFLILASATPDICDMHKAESDDEWNLVSLKSRIHGIKMPEVRIVDMRIEFQRKNFSPISEELDFEIHKTLKKGKQVILFLNRRGFSQSLQCKKCGEIVKCKNCDVPLTHHKSTSDSRGKLICHYCFVLKDVVDICPACSSSSIHKKGTGTQKIEEDLHVRYPDANILRADKDSTSSKASFAKIYEAMKSGAGDILLGTQMIVKGLDLENVDLVGVINADMGLHIPDFRSSERVFQLLTQVAGRAGRKNPGKVLFQTFQPNHEVIQAASMHNYDLIYRKESEMRSLLKYPPFASVIKLTFVHKEKSECMKKSSQMKKYLDEINAAMTDKHIITSAPAYIPKMHGKYFWHILIRGNSPEQFLKTGNFSEWRIDRDPIFLS
ncbi:primosomal protein N' [Candidatus Peregrinibacteria bacterium]|jgi:primosomal protein N' (replication factor Y) (superfamily II helicase)|nr:primosomal protein N' [Candidatus Peregrinibacteria bacterium]